MQYRILKYKDFLKDRDKEITVCECQGRKTFLGFTFFGLFKWKTLHNNDKSHELMEYYSIRKAKDKMEQYLFRDVCSKRKDEFSPRTRYCHLVDLDYIEIQVPVF